jgi:Flp pilus assembly protein TadG
MRPTRDERGSAVLEMALIGTVLFSLLFGLVSFALVEASDNAGSNAAQEGGRVAILDTSCVDAFPGSTTYDSAACPTVPSPAYTAVVTAVERRLGGLTSGTPTITVMCLWGASSGSSSPLDAKPCNSAIVPDVDLVRVSVTWTRQATSPYGTAKTHQDVATMTVQGSGVGTSDTSACLANATVTPNQVSIVDGASSGPLTSSVTVNVYTNGFCATGLTIGFSTSPTTQVTGKTMVPAPNGSDYSFVINPTDYTWSAGTYLFTVTDSLGHAITFVAQPQLIVTSTLCQMTSASLSPGAVVLSGGNPGPLAQDVVLTVTTTAGCGAIDTSFTPSTSQQTVTMSGSQPNYTLHIDKGQFNWSTGTKGFTFTDDASGAAPIGANKQAVNLTVSVQCAITITPNPMTDTISGQTHLANDITVTATPGTGSDCSGLTMTYAHSGGSTTVSMPVQPSGVYQATIKKNADSWTVGTFPITFNATNAATVATSPSPVSLTVN